jgi:hypothetical protein
VSLALMVVLALVVAGCDGATISPATGSPSPSGSAATPSADSSGSPSEAPTESASSEPTVEPTESPSDGPTPSETAGSPSASPSEGGTGVCFGSSDTRDFFAAFAQSVSWPVYCAVLPSGWSVEHGEYRLADGGRLTISYRRRADGARIVLDEGAVCAQTTPCVPPGSDLGTTPFGDRQADMSGSSGALAAVVDETENPAWLLTGTGIGQGDFSSIAAKLHLLDL